MGLDMYLRESKYLGHYQYMADPEFSKGQSGMLDEYNAAQASYEAMGFVNDPAKPNYSIEAEVTIAYWRKAHAIHGWFVKHVQNGVDDCQEAVVTLDQLEALVRACQEVLEDHAKAPELLPATDGFFFGMNREDPYDDWYFKDLEDTIEQLLPIVRKTREAKEPGKSWDPCTFTYLSSW